MSRVTNGRVSDELFLYLKVQFNADQMTSEFRSKAEKHFNQKQEFFRRVDIAVCTFDMKHFSVS